MNGYAYYHNGQPNGNQMDQGGDASNMMLMSQDGMGDMSGGIGGLGGGQSLDDIVNQNAKMIRRQSMPQGYGQSPHHLNPDMRRISMLEYGSGSPAGSMSSYQYDPNMTLDHGGFTSGAVTPAANPNNQSNQSRPSHGDLSLDTGFSGTAHNYSSGIAQNSAMETSPIHQSAGVDMSLDASPYIDSNLAMSMDYGVDSTLGVGQDPMQMNLYNQSQFHQSSFSSPMQSAQHHQGTPGQQVQQQGTPMHQPSPLQQHGTPHSGGQSQYSNQGMGPPSTAARSFSKSHRLQPPNHASPAHVASPLSGQPATAAQPKSQLQSKSSPLHDSSGNNGRGAGFAPQPQHPVPGGSQDRPVGPPVSQDFNGLNGPIGKTGPYNPNNQNFPWEDPEGGWPSTMSGKPHMNSVYKNAYSSTGFDMLGVLMRVATRPNPEINIGSVDLSCAFVVCDAEKDDFPIVYCSENFERLTGYTKHMILGRNCRFLQSPDGNVAPGIRRKYVDDDSVLYLKNMINLRREAQISLINYRRGGQPFMNLLTMIPISWDTEQVKFFVGFQVDLVEQPNAVTNKNPDGSYSINYQRGMTMPRYVVNAPDPATKTDLGQTVPRDDVSAILSTIGTGESEYAKRMWDKVLLENTDDVVHVLSLKGLFQWVSPSALRVLEYEPSEIIGTALSSVCHPSDIVPVTRELKDTSTGASVNVVFRIRRKNSGYMWFEGHGSLHTEQGKGRKSIIMVGRERPVYTLPKTDISKSGGIGENELWTKMSTSGMFLFVSSNVRQLLDRQPDELIGISIQSLMRAESKQEFGRILEHARTGKRASVKHEMINRRGQVLSAFTTLYPGDAEQGEKPTFVVAQTRLIKFSRSSQTGKPPLYHKKDSSESLNSGMQQLSAPIQVGGDSTPLSSGSATRYNTTADSAVTTSGMHGLVIGRQDQSLASEDNLFDELKTTKSSSWQYEIRQLEKRNRMLAEEVQSLIAAKKKRKRRKGAGNQQKDCANCHTRVTPEWRRGPSGQRDLCNSCGLRWAKLNGRVSPRTSSAHSAGASDRGDRASASPRHSISALKHESSMDTTGQRSNSTGDVRESPKTTQKPVPPPEGHSGTMEGASGVPDKIDEGVEPD